MGKQAGRKTFSTEKRKLEIQTFEGRNFILEGGKGAYISKKLNVQILLGNGKWKSKLFEAPNFILGGDWSIYFKKLECPNYIWKQKMEIQTFEGLNFILEVGGIYFQILNVQILKTK